MLPLVMVSCHVQMLSAAKSLFMLSSSSACRPAIAAYEPLEGMLEVLSKHSSQDVRERAAGALRDLARDSRTKQTVLDMKVAVEQLKSGALSRDTNTRAKEAFKAVFGTDRP